MLFAEAVKSTTINKSIQLAQTSGETIYFLYVANLDFLTHSSSSKTNHIAQEQAAEYGVDSKGVIRDGQVVEEIISYCKELDPLYVVLGQPEEEGEDNLVSMIISQHPYYSCTASCNRLPLPDYPRSRIQSFVYLPLHQRRDGW